MNSQLANEVKGILQAYHDGAETITASREAFEIAIEIIVKKTADLMKQKQLVRLDEGICDGSNCANCQHPKPECSAAKHCVSCGDCFMGLALPETKLAFDETSETIEPEIMPEPAVNLTPETLKKFAELMTGNDPSKTITELVEAAYRNLKTWKRSRLPLGMQ